MIHYFKLTVIGQIATTEITRAVSVEECVLLK